MSIADDLDAAQADLKANGGPEPEPGATPPDPSDLASGGRTIPTSAGGKSPPTAYHIVAVLLGEIPADKAGKPTDGLSARLRDSTMPGVPFILGGWESPEVFESTSGPQGAKRAALTAHPEIAACVREPGIALAAWPARSYEFKPVKVEPQPDKLIV